MTAWNPQAIKKHLHKHKKGFTLLALSLTLSGCGGGGTDAIKEAINGPGGVWFGSFLEQEQTENTADIDIGGMYLDIPADITGGVKGGMSYQVYGCQNRNDLEIDGTKTRERLQVTIAQGEIDPRASASGPLDRASKIMAVELKGGYLDKLAEPKPWGGSFDVRNLTDDKTRVSTECNNQTYTQADNGKWSVFPESAQFGIATNYNASNNTLSWTNMKDADQTLIMQLDTSSISNSNKTAFIKQLVQKSNLTTFNPVVQKGKQSTLVVQVFNANRKLIGFDAMTIKQ